MAEPIVVVFGCDRNYAPHLAATMMSVVANARGEPLAFHVIQQDFDAALRARFAAMLAPHANATLAFLDLRIPHEDAYARAGHLTLAAYFRIFIPALLPATLTRAIYLDSDLIVTDSLRALWEMPLGGRALGAARDPLRNPQDLHDRYVKLRLPRDAHYFNSGVLVFDLARWRADGLSARVAQFALEHPERISWADQDALNGVLHDDYAPLPPEWNFQRRMAHMLPRDLGLDVDAYLRLRRRPRIVHFTEATKPWGWRDGHPFAHLYFRYLRLTPFHDEVARSFRVGFDTTLGRWLRRLKNELKVLRPALWWRERTDRAPRPSPADLPAPPA